MEERFESHGQSRWARTSRVPLRNAEGMVIGVAGFAEDITDRQRAEEERKQALNEKDHLMRELNHRVKNNLKMVSSLVHLKDSALGEEIDLSDLSHQIDAIQIVHEKLQDSTEVKHINIRSYVGDLLTAIFRSSTNQHVSVHNRLPDLLVRTRAAVPLGLIVNELATNAIKHGFVGTEHHSFTVTLEADQKEEHYLLNVTNTGRAFPKDIDVEHPDTLGLQLLSALVSQLHGRLDVKREPNPTFTIRFPVEQV